MKRHPFLTRDELRAVRFIAESYPALYYSVFGEVMALSTPETQVQALRAVAEICQEAGKALICCSVIKADELIIERQDLITGSQHHGEKSS